MNRKFVYAFMSEHNTVCVINYDARNNYLNNFLAALDIWGCGREEVSKDENYMEMWFECHKEVWDMLHSETFKKAIERTGTRLVFDYPYQK